MLDVEPIAQEGLGGFTGPGIAAIAPRLHALADLVHQGRQKHLVAQIREHFVSRIPPDAGVEDHVGVCGEVGAEGHMLFVFILYFCGSDSPSLSRFSQIPPFDFGS